jgi:hypothetical protein
MLAERRRQRLDAEELLALDLLQRRRRVFDARVDGVVGGGEDARPLDRRPPSGLSRTGCR